MKRLIRAGVGLGGLTLAASLIVAIVELPPAVVDLPAAVATQMPQSGVAHPVTAVLLNFRGYDTLLEVAVLLIALLTLLGLGREAAPDESVDIKPLLQALASVLLGLRGVELVTLIAVAP